MNTDTCNDDNWTLKYTCEKTLEAKLWAVQSYRVPLVIRREPKPHSAQGLSRHARERHEVLLILQTSTGAKHRVNSTESRSG